MKTYQEFEEEIKVREYLIYNILLHQRDYEFLNNPGDASLIKFFGKRPIFKRSKHAIFKLLCIEVHKLFSNLQNDHFKFTQLLDKIKSHRKNAEWKNDLSRGDIKKIDELINEGLKNESIKGLRNYRNKYLAHTDNDKSDSIFFVQKFYRLIEIAVEIIDILRLKILKNKFTIRIYLESDGYDEIIKLATG